MTFDDDLDARGLLCPLPVLRCRKRLQRLHPGAILRVTTDDPAAWIDIPHFCAEAHHDLLSAETCEDTHVFHVRKSRTG